MTLHHDSAFGPPPDGDVRFGTGAGCPAAGASAAASGGVPFPVRGRRRPDNAETRRGSVPAAAHNTFFARRRPRQSAVRPHPTIVQHSYRDETTQHQQQKRPPLSHRPAAPASHATPALSPSRNIPLRLFGAGRGGIVSNHQAFPPPPRFEIDPPTLSSLTSVSESDDSERLRKLLRTRYPLFRNRPTVLPGAEVEILVPKGDALRDQQRLAAAARRRRLVDAPSSPSLSSSAFSATVSGMIRRRVATGEEVLIPPSDPTSPVFEPERPSSAGGMSGFRDFAPRPRNEYVPPKAPDDSARRERERERERQREEAEMAEKLKKKELKASRASKAFPNIFGRKPSTPGKDKNGDGDWPSPSPDGKVSEEARRSGGAKAIAPRRTSSLSLKSNREGEPLFHGVQKRSGTRSPAHTRDARDAIREPRPTSAASATSATSASSAERERRRTLTSPGIPKHSKIPSSASPSVSRPSSQQDRRTASTISSSTERRPLRNAPSSGSLVSRASESSSSQRGGTQHGRSESHPNPSLHVEKRSIPRPSHVTGRGSPASHMRRSESVPSTSFPISMPGPSGFSRTQSLKTDKSSEGSEKAGGVEVTPSELGDDDDDDDHPDMDSPSIRKMRGNSIDSFLGINNKQTTAATTTSAPDTPTPINVNARPASTSEDAKPEGRILSPTMSDYGLASSGSSGSPLYDRSTGKPKSFPKPKSALEDDEDDLPPLDELQRKDREYQDLLNPAKNDDEEDTYMLLGGSRQYEPNPNRPVRPKAEAAAGDRKRDREKNAHEQLMNRLKTLHLELRSARRGIDYIERRLNGVGSSDEGEWVDDEGETGDDDAISSRMKAEELRQRQRLRAEQAEVAAAAAAAAAAAGDPALLRPYEPSVVVKVGTVGLQLVLLWFLLEIYFFYQAFPPSVSSTPVYSTSIPTFGSQVFDTVTESVVSVFRRVSTGPVAAIAAAISFIMAIIVKFSGFLGAATSMWQGRSSSTAEYTMGSSAVPAGAEFSI